MSLSRHIIDNFYFKIMKKISHLFNTTDTLKDIMNKTVFFTRYRKNNFRSIVLRVIVPVIILGLIIWHVISWNADGIYYEMMNRDKYDVYKVVLYNLALISVTGMTLSISLRELTNAVIKSMRRLNNISNKRQGTG